MLPLRIDFRARSGAQEAFDRALVSGNATGPGHSPARPTVTEPPMSLTDTITKTLVPIHREGWPFVAIAGAATVLVGWFVDPLFWIGLILTAWVAYFFRDPPRVTPIDDGSFLAFRSMAPGLTATPGFSRLTVSAMGSGERRHDASSRSAALIGRRDSLFVS